MNEKKPCALEAAVPGQAVGCETEAPQQAQPCALLCASACEKASPETAGDPPSSAPPEDESADPVGDGHSDAEWAERHPEKKPA